VIKAKAYVWGGENTARKPIDSSLWVKDLLKEEGDWEKVITPSRVIPRPRVAHAQASIGDDIFVFGGRCSVGALSERLVMT